MYFKWSVLILVVAVIGCNPEKEEISTTFEGEFKKKKLDLRWALSDFFSISEGDDTTSSTAYTISYDRKNRINTVLEKNSGDTVFHGHAMKYKGMWFLQEAVTDSTFTLNAIKIKNGAIRGWGETGIQMQKVDSLTRAGKFDDLIKTQTEKEYILEAERKLITGYYQSWVAYAEEKFLVDQGKIDFVAIDSDVTGIDGADIIRMLESMYPNPANDQFTLQLYEQRTVRVKIYDLRGQLIFDEIQETQDKIYDVSSWAPGVYVVALREPDSDRPIDQANLTIRR
jgi:hypothetical protein